MLTGQQQQQQPVKPQNDEQMKQKKKYRGKRKIQRLCRRLHQQGLDPDTITELVNQKINLQQRQQHDEAIQYNRVMCIFLMKYTILIFIYSSRFLNRHNIKIIIRIL